MARSVEAVHLHLDLPGPLRGLLLGEGLGPGNWRKCFPTGLATDHRHPPPWPHAARRSVCSSAFWALCVKKPLYKPQTTTHESAVTSNVGTEEWWGHVCRARPFARFHSQKHSPLRILKRSVVSILFGFSSGVIGVVAPPLGCSSRVGPIMFPRAPSVTPPPQRQGSPVSLLHATPLGATASAGGMAARGPQSNHKLCAAVFEGGAHLNALQF